MTGKLANGWYIMLADLSLILFLVTAASTHDIAPDPVRGNPLPAETVPTAIYRAAPGAPPLDQWLRDQHGDERQGLTIIARYAEGGMAAASAAPARLASTAGQAAPPPRIIVEPGEQAEELAVLTFDRPPVGTAIASTPGQGIGTVSSKGTEDAGD